VRRTKKYVAALKVARQHKVTQAHAHDVLYRRLDAAGWSWDPDMGREGGWFLRAELAPRVAARAERCARRAGAPAGGAEPLDASGVGPFQGMPRAQEAAERLKVERLEAEVAVAMGRIAALERAVLLLNSLDVVRGSVGAVFGVELQERLA